MPQFASVLIFLGQLTACFYLLAVFLHADSDVATPGSTYPAHYFTLPIRTADLVLWPVLSGTVLVGGITFLVGTAIQSAGFGFDPLTATLVVVALLTSMQAVFWSPIGIPYSKLILSLSGIIGLFLVTLSPSVWQVDPDLRSKILLAVAGVSVALTWVGVAKARAGGSAVGSIRASITLRRRKVDRPAFKTPLKAQYWYEWRQQGLVLPLVAILLFLAFLIPGYWRDTLSPVHALRTSNGRMPAVSTFLSVYFPLIVGMIPLFAWVVGFGMKRTELKRNDGSFHLFFATRPMRDETLVWAKLWVALRSTAVTWGLIAAGSLPLLFTAAGHHANNVTSGTSETVLSVLPGYLGMDFMARVATVVAILVFLTWRNLIIGLWTELSGVVAFRYLQPFIAVFAYVSLVSLPRSAQVHFGWVTWLLGAVLTTKLFIAAWVAIDLRRRHLVVDKSLIWLGLGYASAALMLVWSGHYLLAPENQQPEMVAASRTPVTSLNISMIALLCVPLSRVLLAVRALSSNRHR